jgi:hypothetical protein
MAIAVEFHGSRDGIRTDRWFDDFESAARYALQTANSFGMGTSLADPPTEIRIVEDDRMIFAVKVIRGGLDAAGTRPPPTT